MKRLARSCILSARYHVEAASRDLQEVVLKGLATDEQLAHAVRALRHIVSSRSSDARSRGLAVAALKKIGVSPS